MTTPRDDISGLSERLRKTLAGVEPDDFRGDNLAIFIASELEPSIEDETLDDSMTWKQGALDACDRVLDAIHAHYATAIDALRCENNDFANEVARYKSYAEKFEQENAALQARVKELEDECFRLAADTCHAGYGDEHWHHRCREVDQANARALRAEQERDEAYERLKPLSEVVLPWGNVGSGMVSAEAVLAARDLVRRLAGPEKEKKE